MYSSVSYFSIPQHRNVILFTTCTGGLLLRGLVPALLGVPAVLRLVSAVSRAARARRQVPHVLLAEGRRADERFQLLKTATWAHLTTHATTPIAGPHGEHYHAMTLTCTEIDMYHACTSYSIVQNCEYFPASCIVFLGYASINIGIGKHYIRCYLLV